MSCLPPHPHTRTLGKRCSGGWNCIHCFLSPVQNVYTQADEEASYRDAQPSRLTLHQRHRVFIHKVSIYVRADIFILHEYLFLDIANLLLISGTGSLRILKTKRCVLPQQCKAVRAMLMYNTVCVCVCVCV